MTPHPEKIYAKIEKEINYLAKQQIPEERRKLLDPLLEFVQAKVNSGEDIRLTFICTHNSRRSHLAQVWAQTLAAWFGIPRLQSYSAGTEATALYPMIVETLWNSGFEIDSLSEGKNPIYAIKYGRNMPPVLGFSKTLETKFNPETQFAAIMTCTQADEGCPFVPGAEKRFSLPFEDPKAFDNTPQKPEKYRERSLQIAGELFYVLSKIKL